jgi:hypothetical protein
LHAALANNVPLAGQNEKAPKIPWIICFGRDSDERETAVAASASRYKTVMQNPKNPLEPYPFR